MHKLVRDSIIRSFKSSIIIQDNHYSYFTKLSLPTFRKRIQTHVKNTQDFLKKNIKKLQYIKFKFMKN